MDKKVTTKKRGIKIASWTMIVSTLAAIGGQFFVRPKKQTVVDFADRKPSGAGAASDFFSDFPINEPSGFGGSWGNQPLLPPGGGITPVIPFKDRYKGPNVVSYYEQPEFVKDYFKNLVTNLPRNDEEENCGYVAATMLLSYYDTYWNPNFIPDQYNNSDLTILDSLGDKEFDSPGVKDIYEDVWVDCEPMTPPNDKSTSEYKQQYFNHYYDYVKRMLNHKDESFVAYLYDRAIKYGSFRPEEYPVPLSYLEDITAIVNQYFSEMPELAGKVSMKWVYYKHLEGSSEDEQREKLKQQAAERLKRGQPLIYVGDLTSGRSHMCLAYDYFDKGRGSIMVHFGHQNRNKTYTNSYYHYKNFNDFAYLDVSPDLRTIPHNPRFQCNGIAYSCHDLDSFVHKEQIINYGNEKYHAIQCSCGDLRHEEHNFVYISNDTKRCTICGKTVSAPNWSY